MVSAKNLLIVKHWKISAPFGLLALIYLAQAVLVRPDAAALTKYHVSASQAHALGLAIALPYVAIWFVALMGYLYLRSYVKAIQDSPDGLAFRTVSVGVLILALWLPLATIIGGLANQTHVTHPNMTANFVRLANYVNILILVPAFYYVYRGSRQLLAIISKRQRPDIGTSQPLTLLFIGLSALYTYSVLLDPARRHPTANVAIASYYQPDWLIILTLIIPRLLMWYLGIQAAYNIYVYRQKVKGSLYRAALSSLAAGLGAVVVMIIVLRCVQSLASPLSHLGLGLLLAIVYGLLLLIAIGYGLIARGAHRLRKIEEL